MMITGKGWTMHRGDCLEVMPTLGKVDAVVTDPPYGVGLGEIDSALGKDGYASHDDSPDLFHLVADRIVAAVGLAERAAVFTSGRSIHKLPEPSALGGVFLPSGCGCSAFGFVSFAPILFYGKKPGYVGSRPTVISSSETAEKNGHPVPKPIGWMLWLVGLASLASETILDPFAGSGTTGVACLRLGRRFIGIEKDHTYFQLACDRLRAEEQGSTLQAARAGQGALFK